MENTTCAHCGFAISDRAESARYCSDDCSAQARRERRMVPCRGCGELKHTDAKGRARGSVLCHACRRAKPPEVKQREEWARASRATCTECGGLTGRRLSDPRVDLDSVRCWDCWIRSRRPSVRASVSVTSWTCEHCGKECSRKPTKGQRPRFCSDQCQVNAAWHRRRAREKGAFVEDVPRVEVFAADGYRCHICGRMTDKTKVVPHLKAPTIDHIVPLARGGKHERSNCRTACFSCNAKKQDRGGGEQFALVL